MKLIDLFFTVKPSEAQLELCHSIVCVDLPSYSYWHALVEEKNLDKITGCLSWEDLVENPRLTIDGKEAYLKQVDDTEPWHIFWGRDRTVLETTKVKDGKIVTVEAIEQETVKGVGK